MRRPGLQRAFTLTELVIILVIIGALAVFAAPRINIGGFQDFAFREQVVNALRYAQKTATGSRCAVRVDADAGADRISVLLRANGTATSCGDGAFTDPLRHPSRGGPFVVEADRAGVLTSGGQVTFDGRGAASNALVLQFSDGRSVTVEAETGFVDG